MSCAEIVAVPEIPHQKNRAHPRELPLMELLLFPSSIKIHRVDFQEPWGHNAASHAPRKACLCFAILVFEDSAYKNHV